MNNIGSRFALDSILCRIM